METTVELLENLRPRGLTNKGFWRLHNRRRSGFHDTINAHIKWVTAHPPRPIGTNEDIRLRLKFMYAVLEGAGHETIADEVELCEAAWQAIPPADATVWRYQPTVVPLARPRLLPASPGVPQIPFHP